METSIASTQIYTIITHVLSSSLRLLLDVATWLHFHFHFFDIREV